MSDAGTEFRRSAALAAILLSGLVLAGCTAPVARQSDTLDSEACLTEVKLDELAEAIRQCDAVVAAHPLDPRPWNDRSLLHDLAGDHKAACEDTGRAAALAATTRGAASADEQFRLDIRVRLESCRGQSLRRED